MKIKPDQTNWANTKTYKRTKRWMFESVKQWHYECFLSAFAGISNITELETSHEEADTKIILHEMHLREAHNVNVTFFSLSGDTDIVVLLVAFLQDH